MKTKDEFTGYPSIDKPWLKYYSNKAISTPLPECSLYEYIRTRNLDNLSKVALNYYGAEISYGNLLRYIDNAAGALEKIGVKSGDTVTICMVNSPETIILLFAINKLGAVANMEYGASEPSELQSHIINSGSHIVFTLDIFQEKYLQIADSANIDLIVVTSLTHSMSFFNRICAKYFQKQKSIPIPNDARFITWSHFWKMCCMTTTLLSVPDAPAVITYTGGTTGGSKGVLLSNKGVIAVAEQYIAGELNLKRGNTWLQVLPLFIAYGITCSLLIPLSVGMKLIIRLPMSDSLYEICKKFKPNHIIYGPAFWEAFADDNRSIKLDYLIAPISGGDTLREKTELKINNYLLSHGSKYPIMNGYGMTEVGAAVSVNHKHVYEFGSVGVPFVKNVISAFDTETGNELQYGQEGEICISSPSIMLGYVNNEEETNKIIRIHSDGQAWVHTGDLGYITQDGFIHICGRLKRYMLCIANGIQKKVFSLDIESVLNKCPQVSNCVVVPINDAEKNQVPVAFIKPDSTCISLTSLERELEMICIRELNPIYRPVKYIFIDEYPHTKVGKVDYRKLEEQASQYSK